MEMMAFNKYVVYIAVLLSCLTVAQAIDCFKCVSISGRLVACEDPLQNNDTLQATPCKDQGRYTACILISGMLEDTKETIVVRSCGTYHFFDFEGNGPDCGALGYSDRHVAGCLTKCNSDACNSNSTISHHHQPDATQQPIV